MPLKFIKSEITKVQADIIVSPSDGCNFARNYISEIIADLAGNKYKSILSQMQPIKWGNVYLTEAYELPYKYVAHVAIPNWTEKVENTREYLDSCYSEVLYSADEKKCKSIVFPVLGIDMSFPVKDALNIAVRAIDAYLTIKDNLKVFIVTNDDEVYKHITSQYPDLCLEYDMIGEFDASNNLDYRLAHLDYKFIDSLLHYMKRMEYTPVQCYTAAGVDKKLYSKIKNNPNYLPSKNTIIKFAIALHLNLSEAQQLLGTCGYVLSDSLAEDVIIKYYLTQRIYEYNEIQKEIRNRSL